MMYCILVLILMCCVIVSFEKVRFIFSVILPFLIHQRKHMMKQIKDR